MYKDKDDMDSIMKEWLSADGVIVVVPAYSFMPAGLYRIFTDRHVAYEPNFHKQVNNPDYFKHRVGAIIANGGSTRSWMSIALESINITLLAQEQWLWIILAAFFIGFSKTGISSFMMPAIPIIAGVFGGKNSTGIILPMLIVGDIFALYYYNRHAEWNNIKKLLPWTLLRLVLGVIVGIYINDKQFKAFIAISVLICLIILIYTERKGESLKVPKNVLLYAITGMLCGFTSMIGNAAGPIFSVYLLAKGFKKNDFMGTTAWFFFIINLTKVPLQIFFWNNISVKTMILTIIMLPAIALGAVLGVAVIKKLNEKLFHSIIILVTAIAAIRLLIS